MFHSYDVWRYCLFTPSIIQLKTPRRTRYNNSQQVDTHPYSVLTPLNKETMIHAIKKYYLTTDTTFNTYTIEDLDTLLTGHLYPSYVSFLKDVMGQPLGCLISHSFQVRIKAHVYSVYYLDFLSLPKNSSSRELIQTHLFNQRILCPSIQVSLFKKEGAPIPGLVPFVQYKTLFFSLHSSIFVPTLAKHYTVVKIHKENIQELADFLKETHVRFDITIMSDISNIWGLLQRGLLHMYVLKQKGDICGVYALKVERIEWAQFEEEGEKTSVHCIASWNRTFPEVFFRGFLHSLRDIMKEDGTRRILKIDDISDNGIVLMRWLLSNRPFTHNENAYYFYNLVCPCFRMTNTKCFIL
jgi:hypothetical protein